MLALVMISCTAGSHNNKTDILTLEKELNNLANLFQGEVGVYVKHLKTGKEIAINADSLFPTASMIKVPILLTVFHRI